MSIASEFDSTIENIKSDYEGLENIGADLTNIDKNIYNIRTCLDNIYTNLPKTTGEGSNLSLTTLKGRINVDDILGDTQQDTTTGINLFNISAFTTATTIQGVTFTPVANGGIKMSGTSTNTGQLDIAFSYEASGNYTMATIVDGTFTASPQVLCQSSSGNVMYNNAMTSNTTKINSFSNVSATIIRARIYFTSGITFNCTLYTMLLSGTYTSSNLPSFEPYTNGASPNPTYPQDINVVTGTQEVVVQNKNLSLLNSISTINGGYINYSVSQIAEVEEGKTYTLSLKNNTSYTSNVSVRITHSGAYTQQTEGNLIANGVKSYTFTATNNGTLNINTRLGTTDTTNALTEILLEYGSTATDYVAHQEQTKTLHLSGKNLFDEIMEQNGINGATGENEELAIRIRSKNYIKVSATQYTLSIKETGFQTFVYCYDKDKNYLGITAGAWSDIPYTFNPLTNTAYIRFTMRKLDNGSISPSNVSEIQLELGSTATTYEPYYNYELCKIGTYQDRIYKNNDKWYIEKNIGKVANKTNWVVGNMVSNNRCPIPLNSNGLTDTINNYNGINCISNCLIATSQGTQAISTDINIISINNANAYVKFDDATNTKELVKAKLDSMTNFVLYYILKTPTYTEITNETLKNELNELEKMYSYNGQTNISISGNLPMLLSVSALKGE